jgi:hypothetical protein
MRWIRPPVAAADFSNEFDGADRRVIVRFQDQMFRG